MAQEPYLPAKYRGMSEKEIRKEYSRLRSIANKRLARLGATEYSDSQIYRLNAGRFKPLAEVEDWREQTFLLRSVSDFLASEESTVTGARSFTRQKVRELQNAGYNFVTDYQSLRNFTDFMESSRAVQGRNRIVGSDEVAALYRDLQAEGLDPDEMRKEFYTWLDGREIERQANIETARILEEQLGEL